MQNRPQELLPTRWSLINRLKNWDDQESWREFFNLYWKLIYGVAIKAQLTETEAQEAVQETIISVCKNIKQFKADPAAGSFKGWLLKLTHWRIADQLRKRTPDSPGKKRAREVKAGTTTVERIPDPAGQIYVIKHRLAKLFKEALQNVETAAI